MEKLADKVELQNEELQSIVIDLSREKTADQPIIETTFLKNEEIFVKTIFKTNVDENSFTVYGSCRGGCGCRVSAREQKDEINQELESMVEIQWETEDEIKVPHYESQPFVKEEKLVDIDIKLEKMSSSKKVNEPKTKEVSKPKALKTLKPKTSFKNEKTDLKEFESVPDPIVELEPVVFQGASPAKAKKTKPVKNKKTRIIKQQETLKPKLVEKPKLSKKKPVEVKSKISSEAKLIKKEIGLKKTKKPSLTENKIEKELKTKSLKKSKTIGSKKNSVGKVKKTKVENLGTKPKKKK